MALSIDRQGASVSATRNQLLARLHCLKKELGWSDEEYRDILEARTGKRSAGDLTGRELARLVAAIGIQRDPSRKRPVNEWAFIDTAAADRQPLLRKVCALCRAMQVGKPYAEGVARRQHGVERKLEMMDHGELYILVGALQRTRDWGGPRAEADEMERRARGG